MIHKYLPTSDAAVVPGKTYSIRVADTHYSGTLEQLRQKGLTEVAIIAGLKGDKSHGLLAKVYAVAADIVNRAAGMYAPHEAARWTTLVQECLAYKNGGAYNGPVSVFLNIATDAAGRNAYVESVLAKSQQFEGLLALVVAARDNHDNAITALDTAEAVIAYDITQGWPAV